MLWGGTGLSRFPPIARLCREMSPQKALIGAAGCGKASKFPTGADHQRADRRRVVLEGGFAGVDVREVGRIVRSYLGEILRGAAREIAVGKILGGLPSVGKPGGIRPIRTERRRPRREGRHKPQ